MSHDSTRCLGCLGAHHRFLGFLKLAPHKAVVRIKKIPTWLRSYRRLGMRSRAVETLSGTLSLPRWVHAREKDRWIKCNMMICPAPGRQAARHAHTRGLQTPRTNQYLETLKTLCIVSILQLVLSTYELRHLMIVWEDGESETAPSTASSKLRARPGDNVTERSGQKSLPYLYAEG